MLVLPQVVTHQEAPACLNMCLRQIDTLDGPIEADASQLRTFDSSLLAVLLACKRHATKQGKYFVAHDLPTQLQDLAAVYGIEGLIANAE